MRFNSPAEIQGNASDVAEAFDTIVPDWREREAYGVTILGERDFPVVTETSDRVTADDWEAMAEAMWVDPADLHY